MRCPDENELVAFAEGSLDPVAASELDRHLDTCARCTQCIAAFADRGADPGGSLGRGSTLARYVVLRELGRGSMGTVFEAFDPRLDRRIALKVMGHEHRWVDEAKTLGRLSHPNIVTVFDAGVSEDRPYIAMELVEGRDVSAWVDAQRPQHEVVVAFAGAARGLAAAHADGVVHGDLKPENILVGHDSTLKITDFGLARLFDDSREARDAAASGPSVLAGTVAYMAPEQLAGGGPTPASDQYAFCVMLFEALFGDRPARAPGSR